MAFRQWVDLVNWKTEYIPSAGSGLAFLKVQADVVNPTGFPLTIKGGYIKFGGNTTYCFMDEFFTTPRNPHTIDLSLYLPVEQDQMYLQSGMWFTVRGELPHIGILGELQAQPICGHLTCINGQPPRWEPEMPAKEPEQQRPNAN